MIRAFLFLLVTLTLPLTVSADNLEQLLDRLKRQTRPRLVRDFCVTNDQNEIIQLQLKGAVFQAGDLKLIGGIKTLKVLDLTSSNVTDKFFAEITDLPSLQTLILFDTQTGDPTAARMKELPELERLSLCRTELSNAGTKHLRNLKRLRYLDLRGCDLTNAGLKMLPELSNLAQLHLDSTKIDDRFIDMILMMPNLKSLTLYRTGISDKGLSKLATHKNFSWAAAPRKTAEEWAKRIVAGEFEAAESMQTIGIRLPSQGKIGASSIFWQERTEKDQDLHEHPFRIVFEWESRGRSMNLYADANVTRGTIKLKSAGISD